MLINKDQTVLKNISHGLLTIFLLIGSISCSGDDQSTGEGFNDDGVTVEPRVFIGDIILEDQEEVNAFGVENYTRITGSLRLGTGPNDIGNLTPLLSLESIGGNLTILQGALTDLVGLNNLEIVEGSVTIGGAFLESLDGLSLTTVENMYIGGILLENINALANLTSCESLSIRGNFENINALANLTSCERLSIRGNFENINALSNLAFVDFLDIASSELNSLSGISHITNFSKLTIWGPNQLTSLDDLSSNLFQIGNLSISRCDALVNLNGLASLTQLGQINLRSNDNIENLDVLSNVTIQIRVVDISFNPSLTDFCGLKDPFENFGTPGDYDVDNNAYNPTIQDILNGDCSL